VGCDESGNMGKVFDEKAIRLDGSPGADDFSCADDHQSHLALHQDGIFSPLSCLKSHLSSLKYD
jgi:hypothetical protein